MTRDEVRTLLDAWGGEARLDDADPLRFGLRRLAGSLEAGNVPAEAVPELLRGLLNDAPDPQGQSGGTSALQALVLQTDARLKTCERMLVALGFLVLGPQPCSEEEALLEKMAGALGLGPEESDRMRRAADASPARALEEACSAAVTDPQTAGRAGA